MPPFSSPVASLQYISPGTKTYVCPGRIDDLERIPRRFDDRSPSEWLKDNSSTFLGPGGPVLDTRGQKSVHLPSSRDGRTGARMPVHCLKLVCLSQPNCQHYSKQDFHSSGSSSTDCVNTPKLYKKKKNLHSSNVLTHATLATSVTLTFNLLGPQLLPFFRVPQQGLLLPISWCYLHLFPSYQLTSQTALSSVPTSASRILGFQPEDLGKKHRRKQKVHLI